VLVAALAAGTRPAAAGEKGSFGLGLILGEPTGISAKLYLTNDTAIDAAVGGAVIGKGISAHADYLWHPWILVNEAEFVMPAYLGIGARVFDHDRGANDQGDFHLGARLPAGLLFDFRSIPLDAFVELALVVEFRSGDDDHGGPGLALNAGVGARYYF
jgi:hypothetical protein